jgi:hypothetical protein
MIVEMTNDVFSYLEVDQELIYSLKTSVSISTLFTEMQEELILELMRRSNGAVIQYSTKNVLAEDSSDEKQLETHKTILLWTKIINNYWNNYKILLFSPILDEYIREYHCTLY